MKERKIEIDLLKCITMFMILCLHLLGKSNELKHNNNMAWLIEAFCIIAVNCFVLCSGYFQIEKEFKWKRVISIWVQTLFYTVSIFLIGLSFGLFDLNFGNIVKSVFPIITNSYWFVTTYIVLYILSPFLNKLIKGLSKKEFKFLIMFLIIIFCLWPLIPSVKTLDETGGYGIIWFVVLYIVGAYERLHFKQEYKNKNNLILYIGISILCWLSIFVLKGIIGFIGMSEKACFIFYGYNSITIFLSSLFFFRYFSNLKLKVNEKMTNYISEISKLSFAVYLIHEMPLLRSVLYKDILKITSLVGTNKFFIVMIIDAILIYVICLLIEKFRVFIFKKFEINEKIEKILKNIICKIKKMANKVVLLGKNVEL